MDLNPVAVELAEVSLWLNAMYVQDDGATPIIPWFGNQLVCGNSLIGARRQVFAAELLEENRKSKKTWLDIVPERVPIGQPRPPKTVYHFLLPDAGMANYTDKVVRGMAKKETETIRQWRRDFIKPFKAGEIEALLRLSSAVDRLWKRHVELCRIVRERTREAYRFFGYDDGNLYKYRLTTKEKDDFYNRELLSENVPNSSPFRRLKLVMDYWCALWFWPIREADKLPSRDEFLMDLTLILEGTVYESIPATGEQLSLIPDDRPTQAEIDFTNEFGHVNVDALCDEEDGIARLALVRNLAEKQRFHHWELVFADIFADRGGFDLNVGNPPWIKIGWNEGGLLGDYDPLLIWKYSAAQLAVKRAYVIEKRGIGDEYLHEYVAFEGTQNFLNALQNYPVLRGTQSNLFKCFLPQSWYIGTERGVSGFLHPEGVYDDPNGGKLREELYQRLRYHFQFQNQLMLFPIGHREKYSINIHKNAISNTFSHISNIFHPNTIDTSFNHNGIGLCDGIKNDEDQWNLKGHSHRIVSVDADALTLFANLYDEPGTPVLQARLPVVHSRQVVEVLRKFASQPKRLGNLEGEYFSTEMWHEVNAEKDGTIKRTTQFANTPERLILSGPHFYVGKPFSKTPRRICTEKGHYDVLDLTVLPDDYLPRTNYVPACDAETYLKRTPKVTWGSKNPVIDYWRVVASRRIGSSGERTLQGSLSHKGIGHINTVFSIAFQETSKSVNVAATWMSLPFDFFIKTTGKADFRHDLAGQLPILGQQWRMQLDLRALMLNCLTTHYAELWEECWDDAFRQENWTKNDSRLDNGLFANLTPKWQRNCALRTDFERRQTLVEIDVLAAMALDLTLDELCTIYRIQFPVLRQNENDTWYDQNSRIVFTCSKGLTGVGFSRTEWNEIKDMKSGTLERTITDDTLPGGPRERTITYLAPFDRCDREADYTTAWAAFEKRGLK